MPMDAGVCATTGETDAAMTMAALASVRASVPITDQ